MSIEYRKRVYEINNGHWTIPTNFTNVNEDGDPVLEEDPETGNAVIPEDFVELEYFDFEQAEKELALRMVTDNWTSPVSFHRGCYVDIGSHCWLVGTDSELDDIWEENLRRLIDEVLEIPDHVRSYFDEDRWVSDAKTDGRAHTLARHDGCEWSEDIGDTTYFLYKQS